MTFVVAQDRWCTSPSGRAYVRGYDQQTVVGVGMSVQQVIREAGDFCGSLATDFSLKRAMTTCPSPWSPTARATDAG